MGMNLRVSRPSKYAGPHIPSRTWQELTGMPLQASISFAATSQPEDKVNRELYIGNVTTEMTEKSITEYLGKALEQVGFNTKPGNPIIACQISGKYAFVEFRNSEEATKGLNLNNIPFMGVNLKVSRPSKYAGPATAHENWENVLSK